MADRIVTTWDLTYLRDQAQKDVDSGVPLESHLVAASLLAAICNELLERRSRDDVACKHPMIPPTGEKVCREYPNCGCGTDPRK